MVLLLKIKKIVSLHLFALYPQFNFLLQKNFTSIKRLLFGVHILNFTYYSIITIPKTIIQNICIVYLSLQEQLKTLNIELIKNTLPIWLYGFHLKLYFFFKNTKHIHLF
jgi:hypothetical protein